MSKRYFILGGGPLGLSVADTLLDAGKTVHLLDEGNAVGGLATYHEFDGMLIDRYYHFFYWKDHQESENLLKKTKVPYRIFWSKIKSSTYTNSAFYNFDSILQVLKLAKSGFPKVLLTLLKLKFSKLSRALDQVPADKWAEKAFGKSFSDAVWLPLLQDKFGQKYDQISAYWLATRIKRHLSTKVGFPPECKFGYLVGTYKAAFDSIIERIKANGGTVTTGTKIEKILTESSKVSGIQLKDSLITLSPEDILISTVPLASLKQLYPADYLKPFEAAGVILVTFSLNQKLSDEYWTTVADPEIPFKVVIQQNRLYSTGEHEVVYVSKYFYGTNSENDEMIKRTYWEALKKMYPHLQDKDLRKVSVSRSSAAAPLPIINSSNLLPSFKSNLKNFFHAGYEHIFPEDRGVGNSIRVGRYLAKFVLDNVNE